jgi:23S rRNA pseudouridine2604 synthase
MENKTVRLNKAISETGFCSRREADRLIEDGRVMVNGKPAVLGLPVNDTDEIKVDGKIIKRKTQFAYLAFNKPRGITCTTERHIEGNIIDYINYPERIFPVGRLDKDSEGLIFLTSDGNIVNKILRAGNNHEKEYIVTTKEMITEEFIERMSAGVPILDTITKKCFVKNEGPNKFRIILTQGLNRQIRRMCDYLGYEVTKLKRIRIMNISLNNLKTGEWRNLTEDEMKIIHDLVKDSVKTEEASDQNFQD